jgi:zinc-ribbon domain
MEGSRRFCTRCGHELRQGARFCTTCGHTVDEEDHGVATKEDDGAFPGERYGASPDEGDGAFPGERYGADPVEDNGAPLAAEGPAPGREDAAPRPISEEWQQRPAAERNGSTHRSLWLLAIGAVVLLGVGGVGAVLFLLHSSRGGGTAVGNGSPSNIQPSPSPGAKTSLSPSLPPPPSRPTIDGVPVDISAVSTDPNATAVAQTLGAYFGGINSRNFTQAWNTFTLSEQSENPFQQWSSALSTTKDTSVVVQSVQHYPNGDINATVAFQSHQAPQYGPNPGETCTNWSLVYQLVPSGSASPPYLIEKVTLTGAGQVAC